MKQLKSVRVGSFVLGNRLQYKASLQPDTQLLCYTAVCVFGLGGGCNYINVLYSSEANEAAKNITEHVAVHLCSNISKCCSHPAGDLGGTARDPTGPGPNLDCMLRASSFATGAAPIPVTHSGQS